MVSAPRTPRRSSPIGSASVSPSPRPPRPLAPLATKHRPLEPKTKELQIDGLVGSSAPNATATINSTVLNGSLIAYNNMKPDNALQKSSIAMNSTISSVLDYRPSASASTPSLLDSLDANAALGIAANGSQLPSLTTPSNNVKRSTPPGFIQKLYKILSDESLRHLIRWTPPRSSLSMLSTTDRLSSTSHLPSLTCSFQVLRPDEFSRRILPVYFKHNNFASFVRQLNMYGFRKINLIDAVGTAGGGMGIAGAGAISNIWEFAHDEFCREHPERMIEIKRKGASDENVNNVSSMNVAGVIATNNSPSNNASLASLGKEISSIRRLIESYDTRLRNFETERQLLWQDVLNARQQSAQQAAMIQQIMRFLATVFASPNALGNSSNATNSALLMPMRDLMSSPEVQNLFREYNAGQGIPVNPGGTVISTSPRSGRGGSGNAGFIASQPLLIEDVPPSRLHRSNSPSAVNLVSSPANSQLPSTTIPRLSQVPIDPFIIPSSTLPLAEELADRMHDLDHLQDQLLDLKNQQERMRGEDVIIDDDNFDISKYLDDYPLH